MKVKDILSGNPVISVCDDDDLGIATQIMLWAGVHHLPVLDGSERLVGILTDRDILLRRTAVGRAADRELVKSALSDAPATVTPEEDVSEAALRLIGRGVSSLAVTDGGHVIGMLTTTDLVQFLAEPQLGSVADGPTVRDVMHARPLTAAADDHLMDALSRMVEHNIRHLPVISGDRKVIGILSDRDIRTAIGDPSRALELERSRIRLQSLRVGDVMSQQVLTVTARTPLPEAAARFVDQRIGALPVVDDSGCLVGIVSYIDLLRAAAFKEAGPAVRRYPNANHGNHDPHLRR